MLCKLVSKGNFMQLYTDKGSKVIVSSMYIYICGKLTIFSQNILQ